MATSLSARMVVAMNIFTGRAFHQRAVAWEERLL